MVVLVCISKRTHSLVREHILYDTDLENLFAEHGTVTSAKIITDRMTNRSRGFGFVEMSDGAEAAIEALHEAEVEGRKLVVNESRPRDNG